MLSYFGKKRSKALSKYREFILDGVNSKEKLNGGGLQKSTGKMLSEIRKNDIQTFDDRILGDGDFVENILTSQQQDGDILDAELSVNKLIQLLESHFKIDPGDLTIRSKKTKTARDAFVFIGRRLLHKTLTELGDVIGIKKAAASIAFQRGNKICKTLDLQEILRK